MRAEILRPGCPSCGSSNVVYSCEPKCCFNHVCGDCHATFELATRDLGGEFAAESPDQPPDCSDPTTECARCHALTVFHARDKVVCTSCLALLELEFEEVTPG